MGAAFALAIAVGYLVIFGTLQAARLLRAASLRGVAILPTMVAQHRATQPQPELEVFEAHSYRGGDGPPEEGESESWVGLAVSCLEPPHANDAMRPELVYDLVIWDVDE